MNVAKRIFNEAPSTGQEAPRHDGLDLDLLFGQEIEQIVTLRDIQALTDQIARIRARGGRPTPQSSLLQTMHTNYCFAQSGHYTVIYD